MCSNEEPPKPSWMDPIVDYKKEGNLHKDRREARKILQKAQRYVIFEDGLPRKKLTQTGDLRPLLRCLKDDEAGYLLHEIYEGICSTHLGVSILAYKALRQGFYWPTMMKDATIHVRKFEECQRYASISRAPIVELTPIADHVPFAQLGIDLLMAFTLAKGQRKYLIVAIDYFTKWIEVETMTSTTSKNFGNFVWKSIISRFGLPRSIVTDNGLQFDSQEFWVFCNKWKIKLHFASVAHSQRNALAESINKNILDALQKKVRESKGYWPEELSGIMWFYRTIFKTKIGDTIPSCLWNGGRCAIRGWSRKLVDLLLRPKFE